MESTRVDEANPKKKHFVKLHAKIQHKYEEMQKKLEKSKSIDALLTLNEDENFKVSENDITKASEKNDNRLENDNDLQTIEIEDLNKFNYVFVKSVKSEEAIVSEKVESSKEPLKMQDEDFDDKLNHTFSRASLESLSDIGSDDPQYDVKTPSKLRKRAFSKITDFLQAEKQKRVQAKERNKKERLDNVEKLVLCSTPNHSKPEVLKFNFKLATLNIALIEVTHLEELPEGKIRHLTCRFRLGSEKYKSKVMKSHASTVKWQELINLNIYDEFILEIMLLDKETVIGRAFINLQEKQNEKTYQMIIKLEEENAVTNPEMLILLTMSGTNLNNTVLDSHDYKETLNNIELNRRKYAWYSFRDDYRDVGSLTVIVYGAKGLSGHDSYCILELNNDRLQTHTEYKNNNPDWMKIFTFTVTDITSILEVTVYDEKKSENLGKVKLPLLRVESDGKKWYALKDNSLREKAKGNNARILLEVKVQWNLLKSSVRVINPKEEKLLNSEEKLDRHKFARNISRAKAVMSWILFAVQVIKSAFEWDSTKTNAFALFIWVLFCHYFKIWMLPLLFLTPFIWYRPDRFYYINWKRQLMKKYYRLDNEQDDKIEKEEKNRSLRQKISSLQELVQTVQNYIGNFASLGERIKNLANFTEPYLSFLGIFLIIAVGLVMFLIPTKYIFIGWGVHKFTRKILRPNRIPNNEILDLLSRVPDDESLLDCETLPLENIEDEKLN